MWGLFNVGLISNTMVEEKMGTVKRKSIFLIDALGATLSIFFLFFLYSNDAFVGMPQPVLRIFICIAIGFFTYSFTCYIAKPLNWRLYLSTIAILNISYCLFTIYHMILHSSRITLFGYIYFIAEIIVVLTLCFYELKLSRKITY